MKTSTIYILVKKVNGGPSITFGPSIIFGFKSRGQAKLFALRVIDNELGAACIPSDVIKAFKTIFLKTKEIVIPDRFTLSIEEIPFSEEP